ncbi:MAG: HAMP domain-containing protein [Proteobacteria bacterium]|nr:HAMP domain-containing protein [Pseudomonadota bacterium]
MTKKIGIKVSVIVNVFIFLIISAGTYVLMSRQSAKLEAELLSRGQIQSIIGAKMIGQIIEEAIDNGVFSVADAFDKNYEQIGNFDPPKFHTKYDSYLDKAILSLEDEFLLDESLVFAVAVDENGYLPTHNTRYQQPITGDAAKDKVGNRTKRIFNDPVGIQAAKNTTKGLLQVYKRDTGVTMWDVSSPIFVKGKHWGGFRIGLSLEAIDTAKNELKLTLFGIMATILILSLVLIFIIVNHFLTPIKTLSNLANDVANGKKLEEEIKVTNEDEFGEMQKALERLRLSMVIALRRTKK